MKTALCLALTTLLLPCCRERGTCRISEMETNIIEKQPVEATDTCLTPEVLWRMGRVGFPQVSPDGRTLLYSVQYYSLAENRGNSHLYTLRLPDTFGSGTLPASLQITRTPEREQQALWSPDGQSVFFLYACDGVNQLWQMASDGTDRRCLSHVPGGMEAFSLSPDGRRVLYVASVKTKPAVAELYPDLPLSTGRLDDDLMFRHWDTWAGEVPHPFVARLSDRGLEDAVDLLSGEPYEAPMRPFGGMEQLAWAPDGRAVVYTCRKLQGREYAVSTHSDLYWFDVETGKTRNLTADTADIRLLPAEMPLRAGRTVTPARNGYNQNPVFSPDGRYLAYESMERDGYESDWNRLMVYDTQENRHLWLATAFDGDVSSLCWASDSRTLFFVSAVDATLQVFRTDVRHGRVSQVTSGLFDVNGLAWISAPASADSPSAEQDTAALPAGWLVTLRQSMLRPDEIYRIDPETGRMEPLTDENGELFARLRLPVLQQRMVPATDGALIPTWVMLPPGFSAEVSYPAVLFCTGGPQGNNGQFWSYRWNLALMASQGYVAFLPNRRGVSGLGQAWKEQISRDYVGQNMRDYLSATDALAAEPYVDRDRMACVGASYGGYSVYWLAGHHQKRFKAFIAHSGIFNAEAQYLETEELWFENWDAGSFWNRGDEAVARYYEASPHRFADQWDTPILCIHGEKDFRIAYTQALQAFTAARLRGIEAQLLTFPDENHWILKPQNAVLWQRTFFGWLDRWLK